MTRAGGRSGASRISDVTSPATVSKSSVVPGQCTCAVPVATRPIGSAGRRGNTRARLAIETLAHFSENRLFASAGPSGSLPDASTQPLPTPVRSRSTSMPVREMRPSAAEAGSRMSGKVTPADRAEYVSCGSSSGPVTRPVTCRGPLPAGSAGNHEAICATSTPPAIPRSNRGEGPVKAIEPSRARRCVPTTADAGFTPMVSPSRNARPSTRSTRARVSSLSSVTPPATVTAPSRRLGPPPSSSSVTSSTLRWPRPPGSRTSMLACRSSTCPAVNTGTCERRPVSARHALTRREIDDECHAVGLDAVRLDGARQQSMRQRKPAPAAPGEWVRLWTRGG